MHTTQALLIGAWMLALVSRPRSERPALVSPA